MRKKSPSPNCPYKIPPFPFAFCEGCAHNGCYPWNKNPFLRCSKNEGLLPAIIVTTDPEGVKQCLQFQEVTFDIWNAYFADLRREAAWNEKLRKKSFESTVWSSEPLW